MPPTIEIDPELVEEPSRYVDVTTKKDLVHLALRELVERCRRHDMRDLRGAISFRDEDDHEQLREDTNPP